MGSVIHDKRRATAGGYPALWSLLIARPTPNGATAKRIPTTCSQARGWGHTAEHKLLFAFTSFTSVSR